MICNIVKRGILISSFNLHGGNNNPKKSHDYLEFKNHEPMKHGHFKKAVPW